MRIHSSLIFVLIIASSSIDARLFNFHRSLLYWDPITILPKKNKLRKSRKLFLQHINDYAASPRRVLCRSPPQ